MQQSRTVNATCTLCEATCGIVVETRGRTVESIRGDRDDTFSRGYICPKAMGLKDLHEDPDRLRRPLRKVADGWEEMSWDEAFDLVAEKLLLIRKAHGNDAIAVYQGNPTAHNLGLMTWGQVLLRRLGTRNMYSATSADQLPHMLSSLTMLGHQLLFPVPDFERTDFFLMMGANPLVSNGSIMTAPGIKRRLQDLRARGGTLVVIDPRRTETAEIADEHIFIRPGSDALLLLAMLQVIYDEGLDDLGRLAKVVDGEPTVRRLVSAFTPESVAADTGIDAETTRSLARRFAAARRAVCYGRIGVCTQEFGALSSWLINVLNIATGNFDEPGGAMFTTPAVDVVTTASRLGHGGGFGRHRSRVSGLPEFGGELPVSVLAEEIETPGPGQIRALITSAGNPVLSIPNGARLERALPDLDFMVSIDFYINETSRHADVILPGTAPLERDHYDAGFSLVSIRNVAKWAPAVFERDPDQRHDWEIAVELISRLHGPRLMRKLGPLTRKLTRRLSPRHLIDLGLRTGPYGSKLRRGGLSVATLEQNPHGVDLGALESRLPELLRTRRRRIILAPGIYVEDLERLRAQRSRNRDGLVLIGRRHLRSCNSWMHNSYRLVKGKPRCTLLIHPDDAAARGIGDGDQVEIASRVGHVVAPAQLSDEMMPGVVSLPHGWGHHRDDIELSVAREHPGVSLNDVTDEGFFDRLSGNSGFSGVAVVVRAAAAARAADETEARSA
jgi:anaerobic selenocysteine-containing dehydrogenase